MAKKILIVKMSSMGDLVHAIPAVSDLVGHYPDAEIDWVAEEAFVAVPKMTTTPINVIPIALRRWRKKWFDPQTKSERRIFLKQLQATHYDYIVDLQGLLKSALVSKFARGKRHGLDWSSAKEPLSSLFYHTKSHVDWSRTMVDRSRQLMADALGYQVQGEPNFLPNSTAFDLPSLDLDWGHPYAAIMPASSAEVKLWPSDHWQSILQEIQAKGLRIYLFSGNDTELQRAQALAQNIPNAIALPKMPLSEVIAVLAKASLVVGLDSGLTHIAAALGRTTIGIYAPTTSGCVPLMGSGFVRDIGGAGQFAELSEVRNALRVALEHLS